MKRKVLLVALSDALSATTEKGEYTPLYYNPGNFFDEVHFIATNQDTPNLQAMQCTVGDADLHFHNLPLPPYKKTLGHHRLFLGEWVRQGVALAEKAKPSLIRVYGNSYNGYLASQIKKSLRLPLVVSLHTHSDENRGYMPWKQWFISQYSLWREKETLRAADWVLPVYDSICGYAQKRGARKVQVCYNILDGGNLRKKESYQLHSPPRILCVGRQIDGKKPDNIVRAVARTSAELTLVGDGPHHLLLRRIAEELQIEDRVHFYPAIANNELCAMLPDFDIFAFQMDYWGIAKSVMEPMLTGLPIVHSLRNGPIGIELQNEGVVLIENTEEAYYRALTRLLEDHAERERVGRAAHQYAHERFSPEKAEEAYLEIYRSLLS